MASVLCRQHHNKVFIRMKAISKYISDIIINHTLDYRYWCHWASRKPATSLPLSGVQQRIEKGRVEWLIDWVVVLHPTRQKIGHFRDVPQANLLVSYEKTKPNTTKHVHQSKEMYDYTNNNNNNRFMALCPGLPGWASTRRNIHPSTILIIIQSLSASSIYYDP